MATRRLVTIANKRSISSTPNEILKSIGGDNLGLSSALSSKGGAKAGNENGQNNILTLSELSEDNTADLILNHYWAIS